MFIDMHLHEKLHSPDSFISIEEIVQVARKRGLGAVCITDHDNMGFQKVAEEYSRRLDFPIFVGMELLTDKGDITAWAPGLQEKNLPVRMPAQEYLDVVEDLGGFSVACHPYRDNNRGLGDAIASMEHLWGGWRS